MRLQLEHILLIFFLLLVLYYFSRCNCINGFSVGAALSLPQPTGVFCDITERDPDKQCRKLCYCNGAHYGPSPGEKEGEKKLDRQKYPLGHVPWRGQCRTDQTCWRSKDTCESEHSICYKG